MDKTNKYKKRQEELHNLQNSKRTSMSRVILDTIVRDKEENKNVIIIDPKSEYEELKRFIGQEDDEPWDKVISRALGLSK